MFANQLLYQFFGSENSFDVDVVFFVSSMPSSIENRLILAKELGKQLQLDKNFSKINPNLAVLLNGYVSQVYKGTVDELNNALFYTYDLHDQKFENQIKQVLVRDVNLKFLRAARMLLSFLSKTQYRPRIKKALQNDSNLRLQVLKEIDLRKIENFGKAQMTTDIVKSIAFQLGQSIALHFGKELYTKNEIGLEYPQLNIFLNRVDTNDFNELHLFFKHFIKVFEERLPNMTSLIEYDYQLLNSNL